MSFAVSSLALILILRQALQSGRPPSIISHSVDVKFPQKIKADPNVDGSKKNQNCSAFHTKFTQWNGTDNLDSFLLEIRVSKEMLGTDG